MRATGVRIFFFAGGVPWHAPVATHAALRRIVLIHQGGERAVLPPRHVRARLCPPSPRTFAASEAFGGGRVEKLFLRLKLASQA